MNNPLEAFWDQILSRDPVQVKEAYASLDAETRLAVQHHLHEMAAGDGWHVEQRASAAAALTALGLASPTSRRKRHPKREAHGHS